MAYIRRLGMNKAELESTFYYVLQKESKLRKLKEQVENSFTEASILENFTYHDKDFLISVKEKMDSYRNRSIIDSSLKKLKEQMYPEVNGVKYFAKYINQLETPLTSDQKKNLDNELYESCHPNYVRCHLRTNLIAYSDQEKVLKELWKMGVVSLSSHIYFTDDYCYDGGEGFEFYGIKYGQSIYEYLGLKSDDDTTLLEKLQDTVFCDECGQAVEENDLESVKEQFKDVSTYFKVEVAPDTTIDKL